MASEISRVDNRSDKKLLNSQTFKLSRSKFLAIASPKIEISPLKPQSFVKLRGMTVRASVKDSTSMLQTSKYIIELDSDAEGGEPLELAKELQSLNKLDAVYPALEDSTGNPNYTEYTQIIIGFNSSTAKSRAVFAQEKNLTLSEFDQIGDVALFKSGEANLFHLLASLGSDSRVAYAEPNFLGSDYDADLPDIERDQQTVPEPEAFADYWAHNLTNLSDFNNATFGEGITVAIIDTRIDTLHPDLQDSFVGDVSEFEMAYGHIPPPIIKHHGTQCASIVASKKGSDTTCLGVSPGVKIIPISVILGSSDGLMSRIKGLNLCAKIAREKALAQTPGSIKRPVPNLIVNCSWQVSVRPIPISFDEAFQKLLTSGALVVCSSGNDGERNKAHYPSDYIGTVSTAAVRDGDLITAYSNVNRNLAIFAPGGDVTGPNRLGGVICAKFGGGYAYADGTSFASPYAAGMLAYLWSLTPQSDSRDIRNKFISQCTIDISDKNAAFTGLPTAGRVDAKKVALASRQ